MRCFFFISLFISCWTFGQNKKFLIDYNQAERFFYQEQEAGGQEIRLTDFDGAALSAMVITKVNNELSRKLRPELVEDSILNKMAFSAIKYVPRKAYHDRHKWKKEKRSFDYALKLSGSKFRMLEAYRYQIDLLDYVPGGRFYFDRRIGTSELNLYAGRPNKIKDREHEDYEEPIPLSSKTEQKVVETIFEQFESRGAWKSMTSRKYSRIGLACRVETKSLNRSKRPQMYIIVFLLGKQNLQLKKKDYTERILRYDVSN